MKNLFDLLLAILVAVGVGFGLSYYALDRGVIVGARQVGPWITWPSAGTPTPDPYTRAYLARTPELALNVAEGIAFVAHADSAGEPFSGNCTYRLDGTTPQAAFWTLYAINEDGAIITPAGRATHLLSTQLVREEDNSAIVRVSSHLAPGNWLEIAPADTFSLVLTLYDAAEFAGLGKTDTVMPAITREACQ